LKERFFCYFNFWSHLAIKCRINSITSSSTCYLFCDYL